MRWQEAGPIDSDRRSPAPGAPRLASVAALVFVLVAIGVAGLSPGEGASPNRAGWDERGRLWLEPPSQLISEETVAWPAGGFAVEAEITPGQPPAPGTNQEILSLIDGPGEPYLLLGQFPGGFLLRVRDDDPSGDPKRDRYVDRRVGAAPVRLRVAVGADGLRFSVDDVERRFAWRDTGAGRPSAFEGRVLLGSRATGWPAWRGAIHRVRVWADATAEVSEPSAAEPRMPVADWRLDGPPREVVPCALPGCPSLRLPPRVVDPMPALFGVYVHPVRPGRWLPADVLLNLFGFAPLGFLIVRLYARAHPKQSTRAVWIAIVTGLAISAAIELAQWWMPDRTSSAIDLLFNTTGATLGAILAIQRKSNETAPT